MHPSFKAWHKNPILTWYRVTQSVPILCLATYVEKFRDKHREPEARLGMMWEKVVSLVPEEIDSHPKGNNVNG